MEVAMYKLRKSKIVTPLSSLKCTVCKSPNVETVRVSKGLNKIKTCCFSPAPLSLTPSSFTKKLCAVEGALEKKNDFLTALKACT